MGWAYPGTPVLIGDIEIRGGLIHVGRGPGGHWGANACWIDPALEVDPPGGGDTRREVGTYWPSYHSLTSTHRRTYLGWLAGERHPAAISPAFFRLYFFGLERRLVHDRAVQDAPLVIAELDRLLDAGLGSPFIGPAIELRTAALLLSGRPLRPVQPAPRLDGTWQIPLATRIHLGQALANGGPLGADDALLWVLAHHETTLRTPGHRCLAELRRLFAVRFGERHQNGLAMKTPTARIDARYQATYSGSTLIEGAHGQLPDIGSVSAPLERQRTLLRLCEDELIPYSRLIGTRPAASGTIEAALLLPAPLREESLQPAAARARAALAGLLDGAALCSLPVPSVLAALGLELPRNAERPPAALLEKAAAHLEQLGHGLEPDPRHGKLAHLPSDLTLFALGGAIDPDRPAYAAARAAVEVGTMAAAVSGPLTDAQRAALARHLHTHAGLHAPEAARLEALAHALRNRPKPPRNLPARLAGLPPDARPAMLRAAAAVLLAGGPPSPEAVAFLERAAAVLQLDQALVHTGLHETSGAAPARTHGSMDPARLARIRQDTQDASTLLAGIFLETEDAQ